LYNLNSDDAKRGVAGIPVGNANYGVFGQALNYNIFNSKGCFYEKKND